MPSKLKRLPNHSYSIILKFENGDERDECIQSEEFEKIMGQLGSKIIVKYNCKIDPIKN